MMDLKIKDGQTVDLDFVLATRNEEPDNLTS